MFGGFAPGQGYFGQAGLGGTLPADVVLGAASEGRTWRTPARQDWTPPERRTEWQAPPRRTWETSE
jgi:hypothetical protein